MLEGGDFDVPHLKLVAAPFEFYGSSLIARDMIILSALSF
jgi:hypothetical protein